MGEGRFREAAVALILAAAVEDGDLSVPLDRLKRYVLAHSRGYAQESEALPCILRHAIRWYFQLFGRKYNWPLPAVCELTRLLTPAVTAAAGEAAGEPGLEDFRRLYRQLSRRTEDPYPICSLVCPSGGCLFRHQAAMLLGDGQLTELFDLGMAAALGEEGWTDHRALDRVEERLAGPEALPSGASRSLALCYGQQQIVYKPGLLDVARSLATDALITGYDSVRVDERGATIDQLGGGGGAS